MRRPVQRDARPPRIATHRHAGGRQHLIVAHDHGDVVRAVLAVELTGRNERVRLPTAAVVHGDLRVPLSKVESPPAASLAARDRGRTRVPLEVHAQRVVRRERHRQAEVRDGAVG